MSEESSTSRKGWHGPVKTGDLLADRFCVERFLGSGGMGEVFEATDQTLGELVALKVVRADSTSDEKERRRLRREVQLARRVTHKNICRIFDLFLHKDPTTGAELDLISMELLRGETLQELQRREGPLPATTALPIVRQIARGLHAAHSLGIVHHDLKPGNVMLEQKQHGLRASITDFGLAKSMGFDAPLDASVTDHGVLIGSPGYMAPEQLSSEETSEATDIYSLGLILFELLTGQLPFAGETPILMALNRLQRPPIPLQDFLPDVDPAIAELVRACLRRDPEQRLGSAVEFLEILDRGDTGWNIYGFKSSDRQLSSSSSPTAAADSSPRAPEPPRRSRAESAESATEDTKPLSQPIWQQTESSGEPLDEAPAPSRMGKPARIWLVAAGTAIALGAAVWIGFSGSNSRGSAVAASLAADRGENPAVDIDLEEFPELLPKDYVEPSRERREQRDRSIQKAETLLTADDPEAAFRELAAVARALPEDPILARRLAEVHWRLGHEAEASERIAGARNHSRGLPQEERLYIDALFRGFHGDWQLAKNTFKILWQAEPSLELGLWIVESAYHSGKLEALTDIFEALRALPGEAGSDPRIALWQSRLSVRTIDWDAAERLALLALEEAEHRQLPGLVLESKLALYDIYFRKGKDLEARKHLADSDRLAQELGRPIASAWALLKKGLNLDIVGFEPAARVELDRAQDLFEELGSFRGQCEVAIPYATMLSLENQQITELLWLGLEACNRGGYVFGRARVLHHLARKARDSGDFVQAASLFRRSAADMERLGDESGLANSRISLSLLLAQMGRIDEALSNVAISESWFRSSPVAGGSFLSAMVLADLGMRAGRLQEARHWLEEAMDFEPVGGRLLDLYTVQAEIALTLGDSTTLQTSVENLRRHARLLATEDAHQRAQAFEALRLSLDGEIQGSLDLLSAVGPESRFGGDLALLLLQSGARAEARIAADRFREWAGESHYQEFAWAAEIVDSQINTDFTDADLDERVHRLRDIEEEANGLGHRRIAVEAALARGVLQQDSKTLRQVAERADQLLFRRLATRARDLERAL